MTKHSQSAIIAIMRYLLLVVFTIAAALTFLVTREAKQLWKFDSTPAVLSEHTSQKIASPSAILYFSEPSTTYPNLQTPIQTDIMINSGNIEVSEIQIELKYNPSAMTVINTTVPDQMFLGSRDNFSVVFNDVNPTLGRISLAVKTKPSGFPKKGTGTVAMLSFLPKTTSTSMISFTPASSVTSPNSPASILDKTYNTTFTYKPISTTSAQFEQLPL